MPGKFFQDVRDAVSKGKKSLRDAGFIINDDRGNPINLPINEQQPNGLYRTQLASNNPQNVMVKVDVPNSEKNPLGFTPQEAFFVVGTASINQQTGFPTEAGNIQKNVAINNNSSIGKIARTDMNYIPENGSPREGEQGGSRVNLVNNVPSFDDKGKLNQGWTDPYFYVQNSSLINPNTNLPYEYGDRPYDVDPYFGSTTSNARQTGPYDIVYGGQGKKGASKIFSEFKNKPQFDFVHGLDISESTGANRIPPDTSFIGNYPNAFRNIHLGSKFFLQTSQDNEDPVMFGYDIEIIYDSSPLFNGAILEFIDKYSSDDEIMSRAYVWNTFCAQFFKFFKVDQPSVIRNYTTENVDSNLSRNSQAYNPAASTWDPERERLSRIDNNAANIETTTSENKKGNPVGDMAKNKELEEVVVVGSRKGDTTKYKSYYLRKISGLENLVEKNVSVNSESIKSMVDYGKDMIKLSLYEDVSINTGYLAALYKTLSWSRKNGKQIIPENLLRFDAKIKITEIRQFNRVVKKFNDDESLDVFPDQTSKYEYTLYDCQFFFNDMSHDGEIDMASAPKTTDSFDISFNYKYSTMVVEKFKVGIGATGSVTANSYTLDNALSTVTAKRKKDANLAVIQDNELILLNKPVKMSSYDTYYSMDKSDMYVPPIEGGELGYAKSKAMQDLKNTKKVPTDTNTNANTLDKAKSNDMSRKLMSQLGEKLKKAAIREVNRQITTQARLLNKTLDNIRNSIGLGRMSEPTNVYKDVQIRNDVRNAFREFIGDSVRGFFSSE